MVTYLNGFFTVNVVCKSGDTKPTVAENGEAMPNGSICYEMDTKTFYMWDADGAAWIEQ